MYVIDAINTNIYMTKNLIKSNKKRFILLKLYKFTNGDLVKFKSFK